jgi:tetratricopeptide (TPR) repeat protein
MRSSDIFQRFKYADRTFYLGVIVWLWNHFSPRNCWVTLFNSHLVLTIFATYRHSDVLSAIPSGPEDIQNLVAELRRRGNAAFKAQSYYEAEMLYSKALEHDPNGDAAIWGNRSAARLGMRKYTEALQDADHAVKMGWAKGHFRRGQALAGLNRWREAQQAYETCLSLDASNKDASREAEKAKAKADEDESKMDVVIEDNSPAPKKPISDSVKTTPKKEKPTTASNGAETTKAVKDDDEEVEADPSSMRGYKILEDGRKTTFFHQEIDPEVKAKLAQENKPKAISTPAVAGASNGKEGSVWNAAGTFEERDMTKWATDKIKELVKGCSTVFQGPGDSDGIVECTNVSDIDGVASVSFIRGSRRYPFDFTFNVDWTASISEGEFSGKLFFSQFTSDDDSHEAEVRWENREKAGSAAKPLFEHIKKDFRAEVESKLKKFIEEFKKL